MDFCLGHQKYTKSPKTAENDTLCKYKRQGRYNYEKCKKQIQLTINQYEKEIASLELRIEELKKSRDSLIEKDKAKRKFSMANIPIIWKEMGRRISDVEREKTLLLEAIGREKFKVSNLNKTKHVEEILDKYNMKIKNAMSKTSTVKSPFGTHKKKRPYKRFRMGHQLLNLTKFRETPKNSIISKRSHTMVDIDENDITRQSEERDEKHVRFKLTSDFVNEDKDNAKKSESKHHRTVISAKQKYFKRKLREFKEIPQGYRIRKPKMKIRKSLKSYMKKSGKDEHEYRSVLNKVKACMWNECIVIDDETRRDLELSIKNEILTQIEHLINEVNEDSIYDIMCQIEHYIKYSHPNQETNDVRKLELLIKSDILNQIMNEIGVLETYEKNSSIGDHQLAIKTDILNQIANFLITETFMEDKRRNLRETLIGINENQRLLKNALHKMNELNERYFSTSEIKTISAEELQVMSHSKTKQKLLNIFIDNNGSCEGIEKNLKVQPKQTKCFPLTQKSMTQLAEEMQNIEMRHKRGSNFFEMHEVSEMANRNRFQYWRKSFIKEWVTAQEISHDELKEACKKWQKLPLITNAFNVARMCTYSQHNCDEILTVRKQLALKLIAKLKDQNESFEEMLISQEKVYETFYNSVQHDFLAISRAQSKLLKSFMFSMYRDLKHHLVKNNFSKYRDEIRGFIKQWENSIQLTRDITSFNERHLPFVEKHCKDIKNMVTYMDDMRLDIMVHKYLKNEDMEVSKDIVRSESSELQVCVLEGSSPTSTSST